MQSIKIGHGVSFKIRGRDFYGLIIDKTSDVCVLVPVVPSVEGGIVRHSFDEPDAVKKYDKDYVRLNSCPPPYTKLGWVDDIENGSISNSIAVADLGNVMIVSNEKFFNKFRLIEPNDLVKKDDLNRVYNHIFPSQEQKEKYLSMILKKIKQFLDSENVQRLSSEGLVLNMKQNELQKTMSRAERTEALFGHIGRDDDGLDRDRGYGD